METNYETLPLKAQLDNYVAHGRPVGDFLTALLENNLKNAFAHADDANLPRIREYVLYLYNHCPQRCWGNKETVQAWYFKFTADGKLLNSELGKAMRGCKRYESNPEIVETIKDMRERVANGEDPEEVLHEEGFEPDYLFDLV